MNCISSIETHSSPNSFGAALCAFAFYLGNPISSIPCFLIQNLCNRERSISVFRSGLLRSNLVSIRVHSWLMPEIPKKFSLNPREGIK